MIERAILLFKAPALFAALLGATIGFGAGDIATGSLERAAIIAAITAPLAALFATWPKVIMARTEARKSDATAMQAQVQQMFAIEQKAHMDREKDLQLAVMRHARERALMWKTKHVLGNELSAAILHIKMLEYRLTENGIKFDQFICKSFYDIYKAEDDGLLALTEEFQNSNPNEE
jgi:hypothetical protein